MMISERDDVFWTVGAVMKMDIVNTFRTHFGNLLGTELVFI